MKLFSKIMLGALLFTSSAVMAQGKSGSNGKNKTVTIKTHSSKGAMSANEHASANGQIHASDRSILNRPTTTVSTKSNSKYYSKKHGYKKKYYYKNGKRYAYKSSGTRRYVRKAA